MNAIWFNIEISDQLFIDLNMTDRNKNKIKAEINKAVQTVSNITKPTS